MSIKLPWTRLFSSQWIVDVSGMSIVEKGLYMTLVLYMYEERRPIIEDAPKLARWAGCSVRVLKNTLDILLRDEKIIRLEDGRLWSLRVEEELNNSNENLNKFSERAQKAAQAKWAKHHNAKTISDDQDAKHDANGMLNDAKHDANDALSNANSNAQAMLNDAKHDANSNACAMLNDAINNNINNNNIYKKTKTIVLAKKEIDFEDLETIDLVDEPTEVYAVESQSEQIETLETNQPPIHEQENVPKKAKRAQANRGCRLPADFEPDCDFAIAEGLPPERVKVEIAKFRDFWKARAGKDARKTDWQATWRNWVRKAIEDLQKGKNYGKPSTETTEQQRGWSYRVAQHMSNIKNSDSVYKFLFEDDNRTTIPLENGAKTIDCRSGENYLISP
ncbi:DUF1376 domain-containing protein [Bartonella grahamii]|uniref:DUF1376 domain-containing protein n=1 Tax=Bartonella grahamii TaxID=33045 RepID=UPI002E7C15F6|nr:DUF1376 domain-containing protein [Bartonella grahamii]